MSKWKPLGVAAIVRPALGEASGGGVKELLGRPRLVIFGFTPLAILYLSVYSVVYLRSPDTVVPGYLHLFVLVLAVANLLAFLRWKNERLATNVLAFCGFLVLQPTLFTGGSAGTGIIFFQTYIAWVFALTGATMGTLWNLSLLGVATTISILGEFGAVSLAYSSGELLNAGFAYVLTFVTLYAFQSNVEHVRNLAAQREADLRSANDQLREAQALARLGNWVWDVRADRVQSSDEMGRLYGYDMGDFPATFEKTLERVVPEDRVRIERIVAEALRGESPRELPLTDYHVRLPDGRLRTLEGRGRLEADGSGRPGRMLGTVQDVTEARQAEEALAHQAEALRRSNAELERFAYVASHDLREPLRTVTSFVQLLERRYKGRLDAEADDYIRFAVDGAKRMQQLIDDLLEFSRIERAGAPTEPASLERVLEQALFNLDAAVREASARVTHDPLPTVVGNHSQLVAVLQNLLANALKFRRAEPPEVHVSARREDNAWTVSVADNGIGIEPRYFDRLFQMFNRLHTRETYPGTGIGLAICRKIVERHGGRIWVESEPGKGSTFRFTLPA